MDKSSASNNGAQAAFRGYRSQTLYIVNRILDANSQVYRFQPEGQEDLAVYSDKNELLQIVQVKNYSNSLSLSDLSPKQEDSFLRRFVRYHDTSNPPQGLLVSFGQLGPELKNALSDEGSDRTRISQRLRDYGYKSKEIEFIFANLSFVENISEHELTNKIYNYIKKSHIGADPSASFELLMYWIYNASEFKDMIDHNSLANKLFKIGRFLSERMAFHREFHTSICSLENESNWIEVDKLQEEFYAGISARYEHILANLDVIRSEKVEAIIEQFQKRNVLVIHGASGQGKSTLAYRYFHDHCPKLYSYQIKHIRDRRHSLAIILALNSIAQTVEEKLHILIDVEPGNTSWVEVIKELARFSSFQILVVIREEDWNRSESIGAYVLDADLELTFDRNEAEKLYESITNGLGQKRYLDFDEVWLKFGGKGPLLEFTHLVTRGQTLRERLENQINLIREEAANSRDLGRLHLLRIVAFCGSYGVRLDLKKLLGKIAVVDPVYAIKLFEREYLIRTIDNQRYVEGLHPVRSRVLADILYDPHFYPKSNDVLFCLPIVDENDIELFMLSYLVEEDFSDCFEGLFSFTVSTWTGYLGMLRSLLWLGVRDYVFSNEKLINEIHAKFGAWLLMFMGDLTGVLKQDFFSAMKAFDRLSQDTINKYNEFKNRFTDRDTVFDPARRWLTTALPPHLDDVSSMQWKSLGECLFWIGFLKINVQIDLSLLKFEKAIEEEPIDSLADAIVGFYHLGEPGREIIQACRDKLNNRIKKEELIPLIEDNGEKIVVHYIFNVEGQNSKSTDIFNDQSMRLIDLIRRVYPERQVFSTQGYGHNLLEGLPYDHDATFKEINIEQLPLKWLTKINSNFIGLTDWRFRPKTWEEYVTVVMSTRGLILTIFNGLMEGIEHYFSTNPSNPFKNTNLDGYDFLLKNLRERIYLPKVAVDRWGFSSENNDRAILKDSHGDANELTRVYLGIEKFKSYVRHQRDHYNNVYNFLEQGMSVIVARVNNRKDFDDSIGNYFRLSTYNLFDSVKTLRSFQNDFSTIFSNYVDHKKLQSLGKEENRVYESMAGVWKVFAMERFLPQRRLRKRVNENIDVVRNRIFKELSNVIRKHVASLRREQLYENYIILDITDPLLLYDVLDTTHKALKSAIGASRFPDIKRLILDLEFSEFNIVITYKERIFGQIIYSMPLYRLADMMCDTIGPTDIIYRKIKDEELSSLGVGSFLSELPITKGEELNAGIANLYFIVKHLAQMKEIADRVDDNDENGIQVIKDYFGKTSQIIETLCNDSFNLLASMFNQLDLSEDSSLDEELIAADFIRSIVSAVNPNPNTELEGQKCLSIDELPSWTERLEEGLKIAPFLSLYWTKILLLKNDKVGNC